MGFFGRSRFFDFALLLRRCGCDCRFPPRFGKSRKGKICFRTIPWPLESLAFECETSIINYGCMLQVLSVSSVSLDFSNSNYNYDNANANVSFHLCHNRSINPANKAKNNLTNKSAGTARERDLSKQRAWKEKIIYMKESAVLKISCWRIQLPGGEN